MRWLLELRRVLRFRSRTTAKRKNHHTQEKRLSSKFCLRLFAFNRDSLPKSGSDRLFY